MKRVLSLWINTFLITIIIVIFSFSSSFGSAEIKTSQEKISLTLDEINDHCVECENNDEYSLNSAIYFLEGNVKSVLNNIQNAIDNIGASWKAGFNSVISAASNGDGIGLGCIIEKSDNSYENEPAPLIYNESLPDRFSWRDVDGVNWVTPVQNQQSCGSCVAFGTISALESVIQIELGNKLNIDLSEAHLFYCGGGSCSQGWTVSRSVNYVETYGVPLESCFPYIPKQTDCDRTCPDWETQAIKLFDGARIKSFPPQISDVQEALIEYGPLITTFTVYSDFFAYNSGIYEHVSGDVAGGHAVAIVGYDNIEEYWICKNSWGKNWGEGGFFRIRYGQCGIGSTFNTYYLSGVSGGICEEYLPYVLEKPYPSNDAVNIESNIIISWIGGDPNPDDTVTYELYLGKEINNLTFISRLGPYLSNQKTISYNLEHLELETNYYWQVIAIDSDGGRRIGPIWHFSTIDLVAPELRIIKPVAGFKYTDNGETRKQVPSDKAIIYGPINVELFVKDNGSGIKKVDIFCDNKLKKSLSEPPFNWYWNSFSIGEHILTVKAIDFAGNEDEKTVDVVTYISKPISTIYQSFSNLQLKFFDHFPLLQKLIYL
ncbi:MAG: hypothetical protein JSV67_04020 [Thermoplasmatales archaeon]|nr:MAG: hypothetical protein JSV67_04020 [Thermoplasmatales archaeon]